MNRARLERYLAQNGCSLVRHGARHDVWLNHATGARSTIPRHREVSKGTTRALCRDLGVPVPNDLS